MTMRLGLLTAVVSWSIGLPNCPLRASQPAGSEPLSITDLEAYREALEAPLRREVREVTFAELWADSEAIEGQWLGVDGVLRRVFRQEAVGSFPALNEGWLEMPSGDVICLVFPVGPETPPIGERVHFAGRYLRPVRYRAGDGARVAPCLVGPASPERLDLERSESATSPVEMVHEWHVGLALLIFVVVVLGAQHLKRRPSLRRRDELSPGFWTELEKPRPDESRDDAGSLSDES